MPSILVCAELGRRGLIATWLVQNVSLEVRRAFKLQVVADISPVASHLGCRHLSPPESANTCAIIS